MIINRNRLEGTILELGNIGFQENIGTSRMAYSKAFIAGRDYVKQCMEKAGLKTQIDPVGNLTGRLCGKSNRIISIGSHIDTVPGGGMYDGALGVLAGIEAVRTLQENGYFPHNTIEIIAFNEEEGNVVGGTFGSKSFTGQRQEQSALDKLGHYGMCQRDIDDSCRDPYAYRCYLELHIEQGGVLEHTKRDIGIVEGIVGIVRYMVTVQGEANHAGSTPMNLRDDALLKACKLIQGIVTISGEIDPAMTCTVGNVSVEPGAVNVVPGRVTFPIELRTLHTDHITKAIERFQSEFARMNMTVENFLWQDATIMDKSLQETIEDACKSCGYSYQYMPSGAGHDAINMALFTPTAMLFIPSIGGISHSIHEYSRPEDLAAGTQVLLETILKLDNKEQLP